MQMTKSALTGKQLGEKLLASVRQMRSSQAARKTHIAASEVAQVRGRSGLSQSQFAALMGVSARTLQEWEQERRAPSGAARTLLRVAAKHPQVLRELAP